MLAAIESIRDWVTLIRDIGLILGFPVLIGILVRYYRLRLRTVEEENRLLSLLSSERLLEVLAAKEREYKFHEDFLRGQLETAKAEGAKAKGFEQLLAQTTEELNRVRDDLAAARATAQGRTRDPVLRPSDIAEWSPEQIHAYIDQVMMREAFSLAQKDTSIYALYEGEDWNDAVRDRALRLARDQAKRLGLKSQFDAFVRSRFESKGDGRAMPRANGE